MMNRQQKEALIDVVKRDLKDSQATFVVGTKGLTVEAVQELRGKLYAKHGKMKVVKNTLLRRAVADLNGMKDLTPLFEDQIAVVFAPEEAPAIAKVLFDIAQEGKVLSLKGGALDDRLMTADQVESLAKLPSKEVLLAMLCGTLNAPLTNYVRLLNELIARFLRVLKAIEATKQ